MVNPLRIPPSHTPIKQETHYPFLRVLKCAWAARRPLGAAFSTHDVFVVNVLDRKSEGKENYSKEVEVLDQAVFYWSN